MNLYIIKRTRIPLFNPAVLKTFSDIYSLEWSLVLRFFVPKAERSFSVLRALSLSVGVKNFLDGAWNFSFMLASNVEFVFRHYQLFGWSHSAFWARRSEHHAGLQDLWWSPTPLPELVFGSEKTRKCVWKDLAKPTQKDCHLLCQGRRPHCECTWNHEPQLGRHKFAQSTCSEWVASMLISENFCTGKTGKVVTQYQLTSTVSNRYPSPFCSFHTCSMPGSGALVFRSTFFLGFPSRSSDESSVVSVMLGTCSVTVNSGSFVARRFVMMFECSFCTLEGGYSI